MFLFQFHCCGADGADGFRDWAHSTWQEAETSNIVPDSCCISPSEGCGSSSHPSNIYEAVSAVCFVDVIIIIHFYRALFSAPKQPCCAHLTCDSELVECYFTSTETIGLLGMG